MSPDKGVAASRIGAVFFEGELKEPERLPGPSGREDDKINLSVLFRVPKKN